MNKLVVLLVLLSACGGGRPDDDALLADLDEKDWKALCEGIESEQMVIECDGEDVTVEGTTEDQCVSGNLDAFEGCTATVGLWQSCVDGYEDADPCDTDFVPEPCVEVFESCQ